MFEKDFRTGLTLQTALCATTKHYYTTNHPFPLRKDSYIYYYCRKQWHQSLRTMKHPTGSKMGLF